MATLTPICVLLAVAAAVACGDGDDGTTGAGAEGGPGGAASGGTGAGQAGASTGDSAVAGAGGAGNASGASGALGSAGSGGGELIPPLSCTHFASPSGSGDGASESAPFRVADFWPLAKAGDTLCLLDGVYRGADSMITPPYAASDGKCTSYFGGTESAPVTIGALTDGGVEIDGEGKRAPILLACAAWVVVQGVDAHSSSGTVVAVNRSHDVLIRRVVAWDAADENTTVIGVHYGANNVFEDIGAFGVARKTMSCSQGGDHCVCRRCWLRWEGSTNVGPKMALSMWYNSVGQLAENVLATWDNGSMPDVYTAQNNGALVTSGSFAGTHTGGKPDQAYGLFSRDANANTTSAKASIVGSIGYLSGDHRYDPSSLFFLNGEDDVVVKSSVAYAQPTHHDTKKPFWLYGPKNGSLGTGLVAAGLSSVGFTPSDITKEWQQSDVQHATSVSGLQDSVYGRVCHEWVNGAPTTTPLWPWRMNARILAATERSASSSHAHTIYQGNPPVKTLVQDPHAAIDVTAKIQELFGPIPPACWRSD
jgi:hypothetical protein